MSSLSCMVFKAKVSQWREEEAPMELVSLVTYFLFMEKLTVIVFLKLYMTSYLNKKGIKYTKILILLSTISPSKVSGTIACVNENNMFWSGDCYMTETQRMNCLNDIWMKADLSFCGLSINAITQVSSKSKKLHDSVVRKKSNWMTGYCKEVHYWSFKVVK